MFHALFEYQFMQNAFISCILASVVCGIIGVIVLEKKLVMMSGGIAHTAYGGVGLGYMLGFEPIIGAFLFSILAALGIGAAKKRGGVQSDVIIGLFWSFGMAMGIVFIALMPGYPPAMDSYLFGNILSVTRSSLYITFVLTILVVLSIVIFYNYWKAYLFDEEFARIIGVKVTFLEYYLLLLIAITVVVMLRVVGIVLVIALLTAPAATAGLLTKKFNRRIIYAIFIGLFYCIGGLWLSYVLNIASGASIVILSVLVYFITHITRFFYLKKKCVQM